MAITDDLTFDYVNRRMHWTAGADSYTMNQLYTHAQLTFDDAAQMDDRFPMEAITPKSYRFINGWFADPLFFERLTGGAMESVGWTGGEVRMIRYNASTNLVAADIGKVIVGTSTTDSGIILAFDTRYVSSGSEEGVIWIRPDIPASDLFDNPTEAFTITGGTGAGAFTSIAVTGENLLAEINQLGTLTTNPAPQTYVFQERDGSGNADLIGSLTEWWGRGTFSRLILVKEMGTEINGAKISVFAHHYGDEFDHFDLDLSAGGDNPVVLNTKADLNNTTPEAYLLFDVETVAFTVGLILTGGTSGATAEIMAIVTDGADGSLGLGNIKGTFQDNETITDSGSGSATSNGTIGEIYIAYDNQVGAFVVGNTVTWNGGGDSAIIRGFQNDTPAGFLVLEDASSLIADDDALVEGGNTGDVNGVPTVGVLAYEDYSTVQILHCNLDLPYDGQTSNFALLEVVTGGTTGATGVILADTDAGAAGTLTLANVTGSFVDGEALTTPGGGDGNVDSVDAGTPVKTIQKNFQSQSAFPYDVVIDFGSRSVPNMFESTKSRTREDRTTKTYGMSGIRVIEMVVGGYTNCDDDDIGRAVVGGTSADSGVLITYDNSNRLWTVRMDDPAFTGDMFDVVEAFTITGGTGAGTSIGCSIWYALDGEHYQQAADGYAPNKVNPYGSKAGSLWLGARGVFPQNVLSADAQNVSAFDSDNVNRLPPNFQSLAFVGLSASQRIFSAITTGVGSKVVDKNFHDIDTTQNGLGDSGFVRVEGVIPNDTPSSGDIRVVQRDAAGLITGELILAYSSFDNDDQAAFSKFTLTGTTGVALDVNGTDTAYVPLIDKAAGGASESVSLIYGVDRNIVGRVRFYNGSGDVIKEVEQTAVFDVDGHTFNIDPIADDIAS